jgi:hypothetical protein
MRVGVYVDGFNLYYGARGLCGRGTPGWRWLDLRAMADGLVARRANWVGARVDRVVYCTARVDGASNPSPGDPGAGAGRHWWARLTVADLRNHQLPDPAGRYRRPAGW